MLLLFQVLDYDQTQLIRFEDFVKSLVNVAKDMDEIPRQALLMCDSRSANRLLDYDQFSELLLNVVAAGGFDSHEVFNSMTMAICKDTGTKSEMAALFLGDDIYNLSLDDNKHDKSDSEIESALEYGVSVLTCWTNLLMALSVVHYFSHHITYQRMSRLFDLWDLDHSGTLEYQEFALGMRKFQDAKDIDTTVEETMAAMVAYDTNNHKNLDRKEFAEFLIHFAEASDVALSELIDFMVVTSSLRDNSEAEAKYIASIRDRTTNEMKQRAKAAGKQAPGIGGFFGLK
jgi:Ca2+-binding EF-hand superfamily protein